MNEQTNIEEKIRYPFVPTEIIVHIGKPDEAGKDIAIPFIQYIRNVASSEIYPTWPESAITANVLAQVSFALNRIYNEFYRGRGYNFDITSDPGVDQAFIEDRELYEPINKIVDNIFNDYLVSGKQIQPLFAQYCDGIKTKCDGLSQWGSVELAKQGRNPLEIIKYYYGPETRIIENAPVAENIESYPGTPIKLGDGGDIILTLERQLNRISNNYPLIPKIKRVSGIFDIETENSVKQFQNIFNLDVTGVVDKATWYKIKYIYNSVKKLADLYSEGILIEELKPQFGDIELKYGDVGLPVRVLNYYLRVISLFDEDIPNLPTNDVFDENTKTMVIAFQNKYELPGTGIVDSRTRNKIFEVYNELISTVPSKYGENIDEFYPGFFLSLGMTGEDVERLQRFIYQLCIKDKTIPGIAVTGVFDELTERSVMAIQKKIGLPPNGAVGPITWDEIVKLAKSS